MEAVSLERKIKVSKIQKIILSSIKIAGLISIGFIAPNVLGAMVKMGIPIHKRQPESIKRSRESLLKMGLIEYEGKFMRITERGKLYLLKNTENKLVKNKKWDGKWRVLIFDIPEKRKRIRTALRKMFINIGLMKLQNSVWIYPYDCEDIVNLLKADLKIGKDLLYMIVEELEYEISILRYFNLKR